MAVGEEGAEPTSSRVWNSKLGASEIDLKSLRKTTKAAMISSDHNSDGHKKGDLLRSGEANTFVIGPKTMHVLVSADEDYIIPVIGVSRTGKRVTRHLRVARNCKLSLL